ncbi:MAG: TIGR03617 family F420-dependent LLM class oxidoreductase [Acidimicrobiia bacterium]|nr:TIGR03617 family F420-dependent LLM class oxidoreductase [Acidimicrobiia bacterium]MYC46133.1 TIGR03617 family F420-dependent LLM class oxidoreductase [Acidimicrobiia bacterium]MYI19349.1 TIGR03617 family F420-dependent LLM class oxidoreductase [Acidimicrobiia bacterium]
MTLAAAAVSTDRIELGTNIAAALVRNPMTTAHLGWDLQMLSSGRFILGLGSQIRPHVTRRFSMPWSQPAARMEEYVAALHAIWDVWEDGGKLNFRGDYYQHTLMTPIFVPPPQVHGRPKVYMGAVGPLMTRTAGRAADGLLCHSLATADYLPSVALPAVRQGQQATGRPDGSVSIAVSPLVVAADTVESYEAQCQGTRRTIAFSGTVPAYRTLFEHHGWSDACDDLRGLAGLGRWADMPDVIDDEMLRTFAAVGAPDEAAGILVGRFGGLADRLALVTTFDSGSDRPRTERSEWAILLEHLRDAVYAKNTAPEASVRPPG